MCVCVCVCVCMGVRVCGYVGVSFECVRMCMCVWSACGVRMCVCEPFKKVRLLCAIINSLDLCLSSGAVGGIETVVVNSFSVTSFS